MTLDEIVAAIDAFEDELVIFARHPYADALRMERERADLATRTFTYGGYPAGYFEKGMLPSRPGRYRYTPHRGPGHLLMVETIERTGKARCRFPNGDRFRVVSIPEPHVLEIGDLAP